MKNMKNLFTVSEKAYYTIFVVGLILILVVLAYMFTYGDINRFGTIGF